MNSEDFETIYGDNSKRRKTTHVTDDKLIQNPMKNFDLLGKSENVEQELERRIPEIDYVMNSHKKRTFNKMEVVDQNFIGKIPKPSRDFSIIYSKYSDFPTRIPKGQMRI